MRSSHWFHLLTCLFNKKFSKAPYCYDSWSNMCGTEVFRLTPVWDLLVSLASQIVKREPTVAVKDQMPCMWSWSLQMAMNSLWKENTPWHLGLSKPCWVGQVRIQANYLKYRKQFSFSNFKIGTLLYMVCKRSSTLF